jgi:hypothetical protein
MRTMGRATPRIQMARPPLVRAPGADCGVPNAECGMPNPECREASGHGRVELRGLEDIFRLVCPK